MFCRACVSSEVDVTQEVENVDEEVDVTEELEDVDVTEEVDVDEEAGCSMFNDMEEPLDLTVASVKVKILTGKVDSIWSNDMIAPQGSRITGFQPQEMATQQFYSLASTRNLLGKTSVSEFVSPQHQAATWSKASLFSDNFSTNTPAIPE